MIDARGVGRLFYIVKRAVAAVAASTVAVAALFMMPEPVRPQTTEVAVPSPQPEPVVISPYDDIMQQVEGDTGVDWRLLSAIACEESKFDPNAVSEAGARGLMQIMPVVGKHYGAEAAELFDPACNVRVAAQLLCDAERMLSLPQTIDNNDRMRFVLACYHCGIGHLSDARRLARAYGENINSWPVVARYLKLKGDPDYYMHECVANGCFSSGSITAGYVNRVIKLYNSYCSECAGEPARDDA
ncbi:MAG: transglycosylase SLT domain-containing protein [Alistipes sp.]|nr:transglycosylase SLT domain-containing protein [Alistipes sp.]